MAMRTNGGGGGGGERRKEPARWREAAGKEGNEHLDGEDLRQDGEAEVWRQGGYEASCNEHAPRFRSLRREASGLRAGGLAGSRHASAGVSGDTGTSGSGLAAMAARQEQELRAVRAALARAGVRYERTRRALESCSSALEEKTTALESAQHNMTVSGTTISDLRVQVAELSKNLDIQQHRADQLDFVYKQRIKAMQVCVVCVCVCVCGKLGIQRSRFYLRTC